MPALTVHDAQPVRRRPGRPALDADAAATDDALLAMAFETFAELGFERTSLRDLSRRLGIGHNLIHWRFGSKEELWRRAVAPPLLAATQATQALFAAPGQEDLARLRELVAQFCRVSAQAPAVLSLVGQEAREASWRLDYIYDHFIAPFALELDVLLQRVASRSGRTPPSTTAFMILMVNGVGAYFTAQPMMARLGMPTQDPEALAEAAAHCADLLLAGLG